MTNLNVAPFGLSPINLNIASVCDNLTGGDVASTISAALNSIFPNYREAALYWLDYGYKAIPIIPGCKKTAVKWDPWLKNLSELAIKKYWHQHPDHELGFIVGDEILVLDADGPESIAALLEIETVFDVRPNLVVKTTKGVHHHFKRAKGTVAKSDAHCTEKFPTRIDVKTGRALVILPPSTGKYIALNEAKNTNDLTEVGQDFIDAINRHNGRTTPQSTSQSYSVGRKSVNSENSYLGLKALLEHIDPDCGYDDWLRVLAGIFNHTGGTEYGLEIAIDWSSKWKDYKDENETIDKWRSFNLDHPRPVTLGTIIFMVKDGFEIYHAAEDQFEIVIDVAAGVRNDL